MAKKTKQIYKGTISFEVFVSATSNGEAKEKLLHIDPKKVYEKMKYLPGSIAVELTPYEILED